MASGWYNEPRRHSLAARGIKTAIDKKPVITDKGFSYEKKEDQFGRVDENWRKGDNMINIHKSHTGWMVSVWKGNDVVDMHFDTKEEALEQITIIKKDINNFWKEVDAQQHARWTKIKQSGTDYKIDEWLSDDGNTRLTINPVTNYITTRKATFPDEVDEIKTSNSWAVMINPGEFDEKTIGKAIYKRDALKIAKKYMKGDTHGKRMV